MQHKLFEDVQWLHEMLEFNSIGLWTAEVDLKTGSRKMYVNQSMLNLLGVKEQMLLGGRGIQQFFRPLQCQHKLTPSC